MKLDNLEKVLDKYAINDRNFKNVASSLDNVVNDIIRLHAEYIDIIVELYSEGLTPKEYRDITQALKKDGFFKLFDCVMLDKHL